MNNGRIQSVLRQVARENGVTIDVVYREIERVIALGMGSEDPLIRKRWSAIPSRGEAPTAEELIEYLLQRMKEK